MEKYPNVEWVRIGYPLKSVEWTLQGVSRVADGGGESATIRTELPGEKA